MPAHALGPGSLEIGKSGSTKSFAAQTTKAALVPKSDTGDTIYFLDGSADAPEITEEWTLDVTLAQTFDKDSLLDWLLTNSGTTMPFTFRPRSDAESVYSGDLTVVSAQIGGDVKKKNTSDVSFPLAGAPTRKAAPGPRG